MSATRCRCSGALKISIDPSATLASISCCSSEADCRLHRARSYRDAGHAPRYHWLTLQASEECCMADPIDGPLYYERTGPVMAFVHPGQKMKPSVLWAQTTAYLEIVPSRNSLHATKHGHWGSGCPYARRHWRRGDNHRHCGRGASGELIPEPVHTERRTSARCDHC